MFRLIEHLPQSRHLHFDCLLCRTFLGRSSRTQEAKLAFSASHYTMWSQGSPALRGLLLGAFVSSMACRSECSSLISFISHGPWWSYEISDFVLTHSGRNTSVIVTLYGVMVARPFTGAVRSYKIRAALNRVELAKHRSAPALRLITSLLCAHFPNRERHGFLDLRKSDSKQEQRSRTEDQLCARYGSI